MDKNELKTVNKRIASEFGMLVANSNVALELDK